MRSICLFPATIGLCAASLLAAENPSAGPALRAQLGAASAEQDKPAVLEISRRLSLATPGDAQLLQSVVTGFLAEKDPKRAQASLDAASKSATPPAPGAIAELQGDLALASDHPEEALAAWKRAVTTRGALSYPGTLLDRIAGLGPSHGMWPAAVDALRQRLAAGVKGADLARTKASLGLALLQTGAMEPAVKEMVEAGKADASVDLVKANLPRFEAIQRQLPGIVTVLNKARSAPTDLVAQLDAGRFLSALGANAAALAAAEAAHKLDPRSRGAQTLRAHSLRKLGRSDEADALKVAVIVNEQRYLDRLLPVLESTDATLRNGPDGAALARRAANLLAASQPLLALEDALEALKLDPKSGGGALIAGQASSQLGRRADAVRYGKLAAENAPRDAEAWNFSAQLQRRRTDYAGAVASFSQALTLDAKDIDSLRGREACLRTLGRDAEAERDRELAERLSAPKPAAPAKKT